MGHGAAGVSWRVPASCFSQLLTFVFFDTQSGFSAELGCP